MLCFMVHYILGQIMSLKIIVTFSFFLTVQYERSHILETLSCSITLVLLVSYFVKYSS